MEFERLAPDVLLELDLMREEYRIIQAKIDKIGEFKFKIRGWSITVLSAALAGLISEKLSFEYWLVACLIPISFHCLEHKQEVLGNALGKRAKALERIFFLIQRNDKSRKSEILLRKASKDAESTPRVAVEMGIANALPIDYIKLLSIKNNLFFYMQLFLILGLFTIGKYCLRGDYHLCPFL